MTPVANPTTKQEKNFNKAHIKIRRKVERMFSVSGNKGFAAFAFHYACVCKNH